MMLAVPSLPSFPMNHYSISFFVRTPSGELRGATQIVAAQCATMAIMQLDSLILPLVRVGPITWALVGPNLPPSAPRPLCDEMHYLSDAA